MPAVDRERLVVTSLQRGRGTYRRRTGRRADAVSDATGNARATVSAAERADQVIPCFEIARRLAAR